MPQFLVQGFDFQDTDAPARRQAARPAHLEQLKPLLEKGQVLCAGAMLDESGTKVIGSAFMMEMPSRTEIDAWARNEAYSKGKVWERIQITPLRVVVRDGKLTP
jgi:uncharacterized protein YciI